MDTSLVLKSMVEKKVVFSEAMFIFEHIFLCPDDTWKDLLESLWLYWDRIKVGL